VASTGNEHGVVAVMHDGAWSKDSSVVSGPAYATTYVDAYHHLGVFWTGTGWKSHFAATADGTTFDAHDVQGWEPYAGDPFAAVTTDVLLGADAGGTSLARFDPDAFDWYPYLSSTSAIRVTAAAPFGGTGEMLVVGLGPNQELCDVATIDGAWGEVHCRDDIHPAQAVGGEINVTLPQAATLPNGDVVVLYYHQQDQGGVTLAATTLHAGAWSAPDLASGPNTGIAFAAAATTAGDVMVAIGAGYAAALRYAPGKGWSAPISLDAHAGYDVSVARGVCGDDALIAYVGGDTGHEVRLARVRGDVAEATTIADLGEDYPTHVSIATRPATAF
jgi:hypothetical protein